jgi:transposase-like protein
MAGQQSAKAVTGGYRYRRGQRPQTPDQQRTELSRLLADKQCAIRFRSSRIRDLSASLNQMVAQALRDGAPVAALSRITQLSTWTVRRTRLAFDDLQPTGLSPAEHLRLISRLLRELTALEESKVTVEEERRHLLAEASKQGILDDFELASLTGLRPEHIRKITRGVPPRPRRTVPARRPAVSSR